LATSGEQIERAIGLSGIAAIAGQQFHALGLARNNASPRSIFSRHDLRKILADKGKSATVRRG
jgi:hypothetical protein